MRIERVIVTFDGQKHETKDKAVKHLENMFAKDSANPAQELALINNAFKVRGYIYENRKKIGQMLDLLQEIEDVKKCNF